MFCHLTFQSGMTIAPVLANVGPFEELPLKPNPGEVQSSYILHVPSTLNVQISPSH